MNPEPIMSNPPSESPNMRAEFEAWVKDCGCDTDGAWSAWCAAWNRRAAAVPPAPTPLTDAEIEAIVLRQPFVNMSTSAPTPERIASLLKHADEMEYNGWTDDAETIRALAAVAAVSAQAAPRAASTEDLAIREETVYEKSARWAWPDGRPDL